MTYYIVYDASTDEVLACGNSKECAKKLNLTMGSFYSMVTRASKGQRQKYVIIKEDDEESETDEEN